MPSPSLSQIQHLLRKLITAPEGVTTGLAGLTPAERRVAGCVRGDARLSAVERLDVYADMYFYRLRDSLREDFSALFAVIGEANFHNLITDYLINHPPSHFSLRYAGRHLPVFVAGHPLSRQWPYLGDLAQLEWAILEAFDAPDAPPLGAGALTDIQSTRWPEIRFQLTASLRLLAVSWPVHEVWRQAQDETVATDLRPGASRLRVWRQDLRVFHRPIDPVEATALTDIASGLSFAAVCEHVAGADDAGAERVFGLVGSWLADGLLTGVAVGDEAPERRRVDL
jgi:hypothetical protein